LSRSRGRQRRHTAAPAAGSDGRGSLEAQPQTREGVRAPSDKFREPPPTGNPSPQLMGHKASQCRKCKASPPPRAARGGFFQRLFETMESMWRADGAEAGQRRVGRRAPRGGTCSESWEWPHRGDRSSMVCSAVMGSSIMPSLKSSSSSSTWARPAPPRRQGSRTRWLPDPTVVREH